MVVNAIMELYGTYQEPSKKWGFRHKNQSRQTRAREKISYSPQKLMQNHKEMHSIEDNRHIHVSDGLFAMILKDTEPQNLLSRQKYCLSPEGWKGAYPSLQRQELTAPGNGLETSRAYSSIPKKCS